MGRRGVRVWVMQQDNDPTHRGAPAVVQRWARAQGIQVSVLGNWPPNSPDLNPIENVWAYVQRRVDARGCKDFKSFERAVLEEMRQVPKQLLSRLYASMGTRLQKVIALSGGKTGY